MNNLVEQALLYLNTNPWPKWDFLDFAQFAGVPLNSVYQQFHEPTDVLRQSIRFIDHLTQQTPLVFGASTPPPQARDLLLELMLQRFDVMKPYQPAFDHLWQACQMTPSLGWVHARESHPMMVNWLTQTHLPTDWLTVHSLYGVYLYSLYTWLNDHDPMMGTTMSKLDQALGYWFQMLKRLG
jgi:hypothetical protein